MSGKRGIASGPDKAQSPAIRQLLTDVRDLIERARLGVARVLKSEIVLLYWRIGECLRRDVLHERRAEYGKQIVSTLSRQLTVEYGKGFSRQSLFHMIHFAEVFPDCPS